MVAHALLATEGDKSQQAFGVLRSMNKTGVFKCSICFLIVEQMCMKPKAIFCLFALGAEKFSELHVDNSACKQMTKPDVKIIVRNYI